MALESRIQKIKKKMGLEESGVILIMDASGDDAVFLSKEKESDYIQKMERKCIRTGRHLIALERPLVEKELQAMGENPALYLSRSQKRPPLFQPHYEPIENITGPD